MTLARYKFENYLKEIYLDSDTKVALLSGAPFDDPTWWLLSNDQIRDARAAINNIAGTQAHVRHSVFTPGQAGWMDEVDKAIAEYKPDSWKGYTIGDPLSPSAKGTAWRLDDEKLVYPFYEKARQGRASRTSVSTRACCRTTTSSPGPACGSTPPWTTCPRPPRTGRRSTSSSTTARCVRSWRIRPTSSTCSRRPGEIRWVTDLAAIPQKTRRDQRVRRAGHHLRHLCGGQPALRGGGGRPAGQRDGRRSRGVGHRLGVVRLAAVADRSHAPPGDPRRHDEEAGLEDQARAARTARSSARSSARTPRGCTTTRSRETTRSSGTDKLAKMKERTSGPATSATTRTTATSASRSPPDRRHAVIRNRGRESPVFFGSHATHAPLR